MREILLVLFCASSAEAQVAVSSLAADISVRALAGICSVPLKLATRADSPSVWAGPSPNVTVAFKDGLTGTIQLYDSGDGVFGNKDPDEGVWAPYPPFSGWDYQPRIWGRHLFFIRSHYGLGTPVRNIMYLDLGANGRTPGIPQIVATTAANVSFDRLRITGWHASEPLVSWVHNRQEIQYCPLSQCVGGVQTFTPPGNPNLGDAAAAEPFHLGFAIQPGFIWVEAPLGGRRHIRASNGGAAFSWAAGNVDHDFLGSVLPFVMYQTPGAVSLADFFTAQHLMSVTSTVPGKTIDYGAITKRPIINPSNFLDREHPLAWVEWWLEGFDLHSTVRVGFPSGGRPFIRHLIPMETKNRNYQDLDIDQHLVGIFSSTDTSVYLSECHQ